jgi:hypothetical protein
MDVDDTLGLQALVGGYVLHPGRVPSVTGQRGVLAPGLLTRLLRGQDLRQAQRTLGQVFTLCGHAHQHALRLAWIASQGTGVTSDTTGSIVALALETARDHLRNLALDWPRQCGVQPNLSWLAGSPLPLHNAPLPTDAAALVALARRAAVWLEPLLQSSLDAWLRARDDESALQRWCEDAATQVPPAAMLHTWAQHAVLRAARPLASTLDMRIASTLTHLSQALEGEPAFSQYPTLPAGSAETGPWWRSQPYGIGSPSAHSAWSRLAARWRDFVACIASAAVGQAHLHAGAIESSDRTALAWVEMARGVLLYRVRRDSGGCIDQIQVVAPTEWNFHPQGSLACALQELARDDAPTARLLALAWDACVECTVHDNSVS